MGSCAGCEGILTGRQKKWCSSACSKRAGREAHIRKWFNLSLEEYDAILAFQNGGCGICGRPPRSGKSLAVDHDHRSGLVRGLLCFFCNKRVLGARSVEVLVATANYVSDPPAVKALGKEVTAINRPRKTRSPRKRMR